MTAPCPKQTALEKIAADVLMTRQMRSTEEWKHIYEDRCELYQELARQALAAPCPLAAVEGERERLGELNDEAARILARWRTLMERHGWADSDTEKNSVRTRIWFIERTKAALAP